jgi:hypothetical protein
VLDFIFSKAFKAPSSSAFANDARLNAKTIANTAVLNNSLVHSPFTLNKTPALLFDNGSKKKKRFKPGT